MATKKFVVTGEQEKTFYQIFRNLEKEMFVDSSVNPHWINEGMQFLAEGNRVVSPNKDSEPWIEAILLRNLVSLLNFGATDFDYSQPEMQNILEQVGRKQLRLWEKLSRAVVSWPDISLGPDNKFAGHKIKMGGLYQVARDGKIFWPDEAGNLQVDCEPWKLKGGVYLADTRCKPAYAGGEQMWDNDRKYLGWIIEKLRRDGKIANHKYGPQESRFRISALEAEEQIIPFRKRQEPEIVREIRSERAAEFNFISQCFTWMPRVNDGSTNTSVWLSDCFEGRGSRLIGGRSDYGGLAHVDANDSGFHWYRRSFRFLAVLCPAKPR